MAARSPLAPLTRAALPAGALAAALLALALSPARGEGAVDVPSFARDLLPVIEAKCAQCHGEKRQMAELRLDGLASLLAGSEYGPVVVEGDPAASALIQVLNLPREHERHMPPRKKEQLTPEEIELFTEWVRVGVLDEEVVEPVAELPPLELDLSGAIDYARHVRPILERYCFRCHGETKQKAEIRLDVLDPDLVHGPHAGTWQLALDMINGGVMPPSTARQLEDAERRALIGWITASLREASIANEGARKSVLRRLNKAQYTYTLQDLLGLSIDFGRVLPDDGKSKMGFTNNGEVLQASPLHLDYYQEIAREALNQAIVVGERPEPTRYRITFGKGIGAGLVAGKTGGYQSVPLSPDDFVVDVLDAAGEVKVGADEAEQEELDAIKRRISIGLRGSSHSRFRIVDGGMILYAARPHVEKVPKAWQGPSPNLKLEMQRCFPETGDFVLRVKASRGHLVSSRELLLIDLEEPVPQAALEPAIEDAVALEVPDGARVLRASESDQHENLRAVGDTLLPVEVTSPASARFEVDFPEAGYYQVDLVHPASPPDAMPSVRLTLGKLTLDRRMELTEEELLRERAVTPLGAAYVPFGKQTLKVGGPFFVGFSELVLTPLAEDHPAVAPFTAQTEELAAAVAEKTPSLRAFAGTRTDDGMDYKTFDAPQDVVAPLGEARTYTFRGRLENLPIPEPESGDTEILSGFLLLGVWNDHLVKTPEDPGPPVLVESLEFEAPFRTEWPPASHTSIFVPSPHRGDEERYTREVLARFLERAFRRPVEDAEVERYVAFWRAVKDDYEHYEHGVREVLVAALCSPNFLYMAEVDDGSLSQDALACRLSYFLWSSPPDARLRELAREGRLHAELAAETDRLLDDPRARRFVRAFVGEWLRLDRHAGMTVNVNAYPAYTRFVKRDMAEETYAFFHEVLREDLDLFALIDSDFAMLNQNLAEFYGIGGVEGTDFRRVQLPPENDRGGLLLNGAFLVGHSDGTQAHPIKRAVWLKEKILGDPPPPPPPNVPDLDPDAPEVAGLTLKEKLELHRESPSCHDCHLGIDPYGIVFEQYDAVGLFQGERNGEPIDASTTLPDGTAVDGVAEMKAYIVEEVPEAFARSLIEHLLAYALGRDVRYGDEEEIAAILERVRAKGFRLRSVVEGIVTSPSFTRP